MKILAVYPELTLSIIRRVRSPWSCLTERGHSFHFQQTSSFRGALTHAYDVTVLSDWMLPAQSEDYASYCAARAQGRAIVCDLSDGRLLTDPQMRAQLSLASLVTVPTERLKKEVQNILGGGGRGEQRESGAGGEESSQVSKVACLPSCVDLPYFASANRTPMPELTSIGCFGPFDWAGVAPTLWAFHEKHPRYRFLGDPHAATAVNTTLEKPLVVPVDLHPENYPLLLHACSIGLLAPAHPSSPWGVDPIWQWEYGILARPTITLAAVSKDEDVAQQVRKIEQMSGDSVMQRNQGQLAFGEAKLHRATVISNLYYRLYRKQFGHLQ